MSDIEALKQEKLTLIQQMLDMQQRFIAYEHDHGVSGKDYWAATDGPLLDFRKDYQAIANRVVDLAHQIVGSTR